MRNNVPLGLDEVIRTKNFLKLEPINIIIGIFYVYVTYLYI